MASIQFLKIAILTALIIFSSCFKDNDKINPDKPSNITLCNNSQWTVVAASHILKKLQEALGSSFCTVALSLQKPGELRYYLLFKNMSGYSDATEIVLNSQNFITVGKPATSIAIGNSSKDISTYGAANEKGIGIGLMLVKKYADQNNAEIIVTSDERSADFDAVLID